MLRYGDVYLATWGQVSSGVWAWWDGVGQPPVLMTTANCNLRPQDLAQMWQMQLNGTAPINASFVNRAFKFVDGPRQYTSDLLYNRTLPLESRIPAQHLNVFHSHTVLQVAVHAHGLEVLFQMASAMTAWVKGDQVTAVAGLQVRGVPHTLLSLVRRLMVFCVRARTHVQASLAQLEQLLARMRAAEGTGVWKGYYQCVWVARERLVVYDGAWW